MEVFSVFDLYTILITLKKQELLFLPIGNKLQWFENFGPCGTKIEKQEGNTLRGVTIFDFLCNPLLSLGLGIL
jgi:hypothetical protein